MTENSASVAQYWKHVRAEGADEFFLRPVDLSVFDGESLDELRATWERLDMIPGERDGGVLKSEVALAIQARTGK